MFIADSPGGQNPTGCRNVLRSHRPEQGNASATNEDDLFATPNRRDTSNVRFLPSFHTSRTLVGQEPGSPPHSGTSHTVHHVLRQLSTGTRGRVRRPWHLHPHCIPQGVIIPETTTYAEPT